MIVDEFDYSTVMTSVQAIFGTQANIGQGIQAMLVKRVAEGGKFTVVERKKIANVMKEQDFNASNRVKQGSGARVGQIRGADLTLAGDIVVFGRDDRKTSAGVGAGVFGAGGGAIGGSKGEYKAVVVLDYRIIDEETSEIVGTGEARGESKRTSKSFGAAMFAGGVVAGGGFNMTSSNFGETIIGEATMDAVNKLAAEHQRRRPHRRRRRPRKRPRRQSSRRQRLQHHHQRRHRRRPARRPDLHHLSQGQRNQGPLHRRSPGRPNHAPRHANHHRSARQNLRRQLRRRRPARSRRHRSQVGL